MIAHEFGAPVRAAAANKTTVVDQAGSVPSFSRRTTVILVIVGFHILVIFVLATAITLSGAERAVGALEESAS